MNIVYRQNDFFLSQEKIIAYGCNAQYKMGKGIALKIKTDFPEAYEAYMNRSSLMLGDVIPAVSNNRIILNCITQEFYGNDGTKYVSYDAIDKAIKTIDEFLKSSKYDKVAFPKIGCSLGGGDWLIVSAIIEANSKNFQPILYEGVKLIGQEKSSLW